jgi:hypothetical protein
LRSQIIRQAGWIAALYALGRMLITAAGPQTNIAQFYEGTIKAGFNHNDMTVNQAWPLGADTAMPCVNTVSLEKPDRRTYEVAGFWTAVDVREGGSWKIRLLTTVSKPPPQPPK